MNISSLSSARGIWQQLMQTKNSGSSFSITNAQTSNQSTSTQSSSAKSGISGIDPDQLMSLLGGTGSSEESSSTQQSSGGPPRMSGMPPGMMGPPPEETEETSADSETEDTTEVTKDDLTAIKKALEDGGVTVPQGLTDLINSFSDIDSDSSGGINKSEVKSYADKNGISLDQGGKPTKMGGKHQGDQQNESVEITKDDLTALQKSIEDSGAAVPQQLTDLINSFSDADTDNSGSISKDEYKTFADKNDKSQSVTKDDLANLQKSIEESGAAVPQQLTDLINSFSDADTDKSGTISKDEYKTFADKNDKTQSVTKDDLVNLQKSIEESGAAVPQKLTDLINSFTDADIDKNGAVSKSEFKAFFKKDATSQSSVASTSDTSSNTSSSTATSSAASSGTLNRMLIKLMMNAYNTNTSKISTLTSNESQLGLVA